MDAAAETGLTHPYRGNPLVRWKVNHQLFFVCIQLLIVNLSRLEVAIKDEDRCAILLGLHRLTELLHGSAVAMKLAADFSRASYENVVRLDMSGQDPGFSGAFSADHAHMLRRLPVLKAVPSFAFDEYSNFLTAIDATYRAHANVCEAAVGGAAPSLAQGSTTILTTEATAASQLRGTLRRRTLERAGCPVSGVNLQR